jgi:hypothetical protein
MVAKCFVEIKPLLRTEGIIMCCMARAIGYLAGR